MLQCDIACIQDAALGAVVKVNSFQAWMRDILLALAPAGSQIMMGWLILG